MSSINGQELQHALIDFQAVGSGRTFGFSTFRSLDFEDSAEKEAVKDSQGQNISYIIKPQQTTASISLLTSEMVRFWEWLVLEAAQLRAANPGIPIGPGQVAFDAQVSAGQTLNNQMVRKLKTVLIQKDKFSSKDDQSALVTEVPLFVLRITDELDRTLIQYRRR